MSETIDERIARLHRRGVIDMHFDLPMDLYDKRARQNVLATDFLEDLEAGDIGVGDGNFGAGGEQEADGGGFKCRGGVRSKR